MRRFAPGQNIAWRSIEHADHAPHTAVPFTVVRDEGDEVVLYMPEGSRWMIRTGQLGGPRDRFLVKWDGGHAPYRDWSGTNALVFHRLGDAHSIWLARDAATEAVAWWYINLEEPWVRTPIGFDSRDEILDLTLEPGAHWRWKDEDELEWAIANGRIGAGARERLRAEGERAVERFAGRHSPLDEDWLAWRPDPSWRIPMLPDRWRDYEPGPE